MTVREEIVAFNQLLSEPLNDSGGSVSAMKSSAEVGADRSAGTECRI